MFCLTIIGFWTVHQLTIMDGNKKHQPLTFEKLEPANLGLKKRQMIIRLSKYLQINFLSIN